MAIKRNKDGTFAKGWEGGPGRKKGSRNKLGETFLTAMLEDFEENGVEAIKRVREEKPEVYLTTIARIIPTKIDLTNETVTWVIQAEPESKTAEEWQQKHSKSSGSHSQDRKPH